MSNSKTVTNWAVASVNTGKVVKNAATRDQARTWRNSQKNPEAFRIVDRRS